MTPLLFRLFALCLALSWVPVTAHCRMESIGWEVAACAAACHDHAAPDAAPDGCELVEEGLYKTGLSFNVTPPVLALACVCLPVPIVEVPAEFYPLAVSRPPEWLPTWHFLRRAAAPAHAPDWLSA